MQNAIKESVREKYAEAARLAGGGCCGAQAVGASSCNPITSNLYSADQAGTVPEAAMLASLGCGNPTALAELKPGETVLDLGWTGLSHRLPVAGGIDVTLHVSCAASSRPCGSCAVSGPIRNLQAGTGELDSGRCSTNSARRCMMLRQNAARLGDSANRPAIPVMTISSRDVRENDMLLLRLAPLGKGLSRWCVTVLRVGERAVSHIARISAEGVAYGFRQSGIGLNEFGRRGL